MSLYKKSALLLVALAVTAGVVLYIVDPFNGKGQETSEPTSTPPAVLSPDKAKLAPDLIGTEGWINSQPFSLVELRGSVVLVDFWTYTCVNCIRTFPYLKEWHSKYGDKGLTIVGVHTPEFEKKLQNVQTAVEQHGLEHPIVQDNDRFTWGAFNNRFWPAKYLIDKDGKIRYTHFGEGAYDETEAAIRKLLLEADFSLEGVVAGQDPGPQFDPQARSEDFETSITRELYAGYLRNYDFNGLYVDHDEYYDGQDKVVFYQDHGEHRNHFIYLQGPWENGVESLKHARETEEFEDYMAINYYATSVNAVINPEGSSPFRVLVTIDGRPLTEEEKGQDILFDDQDRSYILVDEPRMYALVETPEFGGHELKLSSNSSAFALFAFTFGAYSEGP